MMNNVKTNLVWNVICYAPSFSIFCDEKLTLF